MPTVAPPRAPLRAPGERSIFAGMADLDCVLLAAGASVRMGRWKPLLPWRGATVVEASAAAALSACSRVLLVVGHRGDELAGLFSGRPRLEVVPNAGYLAGLFSSIRAGVERVRSPRFFIALADMPLVRPELYLALLDEPEAEAVRPVYRGTPGHPVLLSARIIPLIREESEDSTMRNVLARVGCRDVPVDEPGAVLDLDEPADYDRLSRL